MSVAGILLTGAIISGYALALSPRATAAGNCAVSVPAAKCAALLAAAPPPLITSQPVPAPGSPPQPIAPPSPLAQPPTAVPCGPSFFDAATAAQLTAQFGLIDCFRFTDRPVWLVVATGMDADAATTRGGEMIALDRCAISDSACLNPDLTHTFSSFSVYYPPQPAPGGGRVDAVFGSGLLDFTTPCGPVLFDVSRAVWYSQAYLSDLEHGGADPTLTTPASVTGSAALVTSAPPATGGCR